MAVIDESENQNIGGVCYRSLFSHKPGERFLYNGSLFTRLVFSDSLVMWLVCNGVNAESLQIIRDTFLAVDQFGVVNVFSREENVVTVTSFPDWSQMYRTQPDGFPDANKILVNQSPAFLEKKYANRKKETNNDA